MTTVHWILGSVVKGRQAEFSGQAKLAEWVRRPPQDGFGRLGLNVSRSMACEQGDRRNGKDMSNMYCCGLCAGGGCCRLPSRRRLAAYRLHTPAVCENSDDLLPFYYELPWTTEILSAHLTR